MHNGQGGTLLCFNGGNLSAHDRLQLFLSDIKVAGFSEISNRGCDGHVDITPPIQYRYW